MNKKYNLGLSLKLQTARNIKFQNTENYSEFSTRLSRN